MKYILLLVSLSFSQDINQTALNICREERTKSEDYYVAVIQQLQKALRIEDDSTKTLKAFHDSVLTKKK